jgi:hypothetical protein
MTANHGALEHKQGFFAVFNGEGNFDADRILAEWAKPFDLADPGIAFKRHPCCGSTHPAADAMLDLRATHTLAPRSASSGSNLRPIRAGCSTPTGPIRKVVSMASSAFNMCSPARSCTVS